MTNDQEPIFNVKARDKEGRWWAIDVESWWLSVPKPEKGEGRWEMKSGGSLRNGVPSGWLGLRVLGPARFLGDDEVTAEAVDRKLTAHGHEIFAYDDGRVTVHLSGDAGSYTFRDPIEATDLGHVLQYAAAVAEQHFDQEAYDDSLLDAAADETPEAAP